MRTGAVPARRSTLVGRDRELAAIRDLALHGDGRLITLTGVGGVGKTTLALEVARTVGAELPDGARVIDLATLPVAAGPDALVVACLRNLGLAEQARAPIDVLVEHLEPRQTILVLDNCEHVGAVVGGLADRLLSACPYLRLLATSRVALRVRGEIVFAVEPLAVPDAAAPASRAHLAGVHSVDLFLLRARAADPGFALDDDNGAAIAGICRRLDGLPLAIELAAAHVGGLSATEIEARLGDAESLLRTDLLATPERHQTLEAALGWSHRLLSPDNQVLLRRLSIFVGGWTLEAAEAISSPDGAVPGIASGLTSLVEQSLVVREHEGPASRFRFLQPVAEFAARQLDTAGERAALALPHAEYYLALASRRQRGAFAQPTPDELDLIGKEYLNCIAAIRFAEAAGVAQIVLGYVAALASYWRQRGYLEDGIEHFEQAFVLAGPEPSFAREFASLVLADFQRLLGRLDIATRHADAALAIAEVLDDAEGRRTALAIHGDVAAAAADYEGARAWYEAAWPFVVAQPHPQATGYWHANVGFICLRDGELDEAGSHLEAALAALAETDLTWYTGRVHCWLGAVERRRGRLGEARGHLTRGLDDLVRYGARVDAIDGIEELARVALDERQPSKAASLLAAATALRDSMSLPPDRAVRGLLAADIDRAREALGPSAFAAAWGHGRGVSFEEVVRLPGAPALPATAGRDGRRPPRGSQLTRREREVAELIGQGLTNPQIAERLFISTGTVRGHVEQILGKLGLTSRVHVATWVVAQAEKPVT